MISKVLDWLGFGSQGNGQHRHDHHHDHAHGHTHGVVDPTIATTARGIWAIKWSFLILAATALLQLVVVYFSGSVALLARPWRYSASVSVASRTSSACDA